MEFCTVYAISRAVWLQTNLGRCDEDEDRLVAIIVSRPSSISSLHSKRDFEISNNDSRR